jgi:hypothetical protein
MRHVPRIIYSCASLFLARSASSPLSRIATHDHQERSVQSFSLHIQARPTFSCLRGFAAREAAAGPGADRASKTSVN